MERGGREREMRVKKIIMKRGKREGRWEVRGRKDDSRERERIIIENKKINRKYRNQTRKKKEKKNGEDKEERK